MAITYEPIATQTLSSSTTSVTFSSIPQTYTDLHLVFNGTSSAAGAVGLGFRFNSDSGSNNDYSFRMVYGTGGSAAGNYSTNYPEGYFGNVWTTPAISRADIIGYSNNTTYKSILSRTDDAANRVAAWVSTWRSTSPIHTLQIITTNSDTYQTGSTFTLYGIKAA